MKLHLLYTAIWMLGLSLKKEKKTVIRYSVRQPFLAVLQIMYRTFPIRAYADRENTAHLPTERIRQKQRCRKRFSAACGIKSFNSLSWRSGFGGIKGEKERFVFLKDFLSEQSVGNRFLLFCLFIRQKTAKRDKKIVYFTKNSQKHILSQAKITGL